MLSKFITEKSEHECEPEDYFAKNPKNYRDQKEDLKRGLDFLYSFKHALSELHPSVMPIIEALIKNDID